MMTRVSPGTMTPAPTEFSRKVAANTIPYPQGGSRYGRRRSMIRSTTAQYRKGHRKGLAPAGARI
jgi:hypothetical protein